MKTIDNVDELSKEADELLNNAGKSSISKEYLMSDLRYCAAVKKMMDELGCNSFTTACMELCATRLPMKNKCTPCLTHSLLKDLMIPTACEEDLNALMAVIIFMYMAKKSVFMGNASLVKPNARPLEDLRVSELVSGPKEGFDEYVLEVRHSTPSRKMEGFDSKDMKYDLGHFTYEGWGGKFQIDMAKGNTKTVTIGRFSRDGNSIILTRGEIVGCAYHNIGCSPDVYYKIEGGAWEFVHKLAELGFGHHLAVVYGDYVEDIIKLGKLMGFNVVWHK